MSTNSTCTACNICTKNWRNPTAQEQKHHDPHPLTQEGADRLREELMHLKRKVRPQIIADIAEARAHGDLKENAEYHAAREQQGFTEGRIQHLEGTLSSAQIIDVTKLNPVAKSFSARR